MTFPNSKACVSMSYIDTPVSIDITDSKTPHDRVLVVQGKKFYVNSGHLRTFSEFFDGLFNANFMENTLKEIPLKDINADAFANFLQAVVCPMNFNVTEENLPGLMILSGLYICPYVWSQCISFLKNQDQFKKFQMSDLLEWSQGCYSNELKAMIDEYLVSGKPIHFENLLSMETEIEFAVKYELDSYMKCLESNLCIHMLEYDTECLLELAVIYNLEDLKENIGIHLVELMNSASCVTAVKDKINNQLSRAVAVFSLARESNFLNAVLNESPAAVRSVAEVLLSVMFTKEKNKKTTCSTFLEISNSYGLDFLKSFVVDCLEEKLRVQSSLEELVIVLEANQRCPSDIMQKKVETVIDKKFQSEKDKRDVINEYLELTQKYSLVLPKESVEDYLIEVCAEKVEDNLIEMAVWTNKYNLQSIQMLMYDHFEHILLGFPVTGELLDFEQLDKDNTSGISDLKSCLEEFLVSKFKKEEKTVKCLHFYLKLAYKYNFTELRESILTVLESLFKGNTAHQYIQLAFEFNLNGLKKILAEHLRTCNVNNLSVEYKKAIYYTSPDVKDFAYRNLLNLDVHEEK